MRMQLKVYVPHPEGLFPATIARIEEDEMQHGSVFKVGFKTAEGEVMEIFSQNYSEKSKFGEFVQKVLGSRPADLDVDGLVGRKIQILVEHNKKDDKIFDKITKFVAMGQQNDPFEES